MVRRIGIVGLGNVGEAVVNSLRKYSSLIARRTGLKIEIKGICDKDKRKKKVARRFSLSFTTVASTLIEDPRIDIIVELIGGREPARTFIIDALKKGKSVVTANKALLSTHGREIFSLAKRKNQTVGFEGSVCGAIPVIKSISQGLVSCEIKEIYGILNGTTNYILYKMGKEKIDFSSALKEAQSKGIAERNPYLDIEGIDTLHKLTILSYLCFGIWPPLKKVYTEGISNISLLDILYAEELNYRIKLLAIAKKKKGTLDLRVHPTLIPIEHPLSETSLSYNALYLNTQPAGELLFYGEGAGGVPTSSAIISDIVNISLKEKEVLREPSEKLKIKSVGEIMARYYIRFIAQDRPGVLAKIFKILASFNISIASVTQKERSEGKFVPVVMITHEAKEDSIKRAFVLIDKLPVIKKPSQIIRIEDI
jgi:homoserine dehydrogenase